MSGGRGNLAAVIAASHVAVPYRPRMIWAAKCFRVSDAVGIIQNGVRVVPKHEDVRFSWFVTSSQGARRQVKTSATESSSVRRNSSVLNLPHHHFSTGDWTSLTCLSCHILILDLYDICRSVSIPGPKRHMYRLCPEQGGEGEGGGRGCFLALS